MLLSESTRCDGVVGQGLRLRGLLSGSLRLLVDFRGLGLHLLDAGLCACVYVLNVLGILRGQVVQLIGLVDQRRGFLANVVLAGATDRSRHAPCQQNDQRSAIHL